MARWLAFARRARRPAPLVADVALALLLVALSLVNVETGRTGHGASPTDTEIHLSSPPHGLGPRDPWNVEITVLRGGKPVTRSKIAPLLAIENGSTGKWTTYEARPTGKPGIYRVRAVFPDRGVYSYSVLYGGFEQTVTIGKPTATAPSGPALNAAHGATSDSGSFPVWPVVLTLLATLPVAVRRRYPIPVLAVTLAAALVLQVGYGSFQPIGALVAFYTVAAHVGRPTSVHVAAGTAVALAFTNLERDPRTRLVVLLNAAIYAVFAAAWLLGDNLRTRRAYLLAVEERADRLEREREANAQRAAAEEQARIARELHDIIAHNVSVMTVQAAAAGDAFETQPGRVREALSSIESTGREALTELRRLLGSVRPADSPGTFAPQPGLARLDDLIEQVRATGLAVELTVEGGPRELPPGVDLSAYRIVQEALTNILKHAHASHATVLVRYRTGTLDVEVVDDGRRATVDGAERGHGIIGMRERAALVGGELRAGPAASGGFIVQARIPLEESER
jgi:signal transduction histidine kinase